jgi:hypothetical protein
MRTRIGPCPPLARGGSSGERLCRFEHEESVHRPELAGLDGSLALNRIREGQAERLLTQQPLDVGAFEQGDAGLLAEGDREEVHERQRGLLLRADVHDGQLGFPLGLRVLGKRGRMRAKQPCHARGRDQEFSRDRHVHTLVVPSCAQVPLCCESLRVADALGSRD